MNNKNNNKKKKKKKIIFIVKEKKKNYNFENFGVAPAPFCILATAAFITSFVCNIMEFQVAIYSKLSFTVWSRL